jgi:signal transduction histidine kinase
VEVSHREALRETLDRLRLEVAQLRASRERLVRGADADRSRIERDLHDGVRQHLVALSVNLQMAASVVDADSAAAKKLLEEMGRDVQQALDETAQLSQRIYPSLLDARGLAAALRAAAASAGIDASVDVAARASYPPELAAAAYLCCLEALDHVGAGARATVTLRDEEGALAFEVVGEGGISRSAQQLDRLRDRVEALGGRLAMRSERDHALRVSGSLPLSR